MFPKNLGFEQLAASYCSSFFFLSLHPSSLKHDLSHVLSVIWSNEYGILQNAKRGGHGASKNKIGSRGDDKVISVALFSLSSFRAGNFKRVRSNASGLILVMYKLISNMSNL